MTVVILFFTFSMMATKLKATKSNIIHDIVKGVPVENEANSNEEMMPLPYCKAPMNAAAEPTIVEGTEKLPLFPFYRRVQTSLPGVYEAFWLRCVVRVKSKNRPREGLETLPNGFLGDVLADM